MKRKLLEGIFPCTLCTLDGTYYIKNEQLIYLYAVTLRYNEFVGTTKLIH